MSVNEMASKVEEPTLVADELKAMERMLEVSHRTFSLSIAICNSPSLRDHLIGRVREKYPGIKVVSVTGTTTDVFGHVASDMATSDSGMQEVQAIFITGLERLLRSDSDESKLRSLNASRELWERKFRCPVVLWIPEFVATRLSTHARDLWRYRSHRFEFAVAPSEPAADSRDRPRREPNYILNLSLDEKIARIAELERRLKEEAEIDNSESYTHVMNWINELGILNSELGHFDEAERRWSELLAMATRSSSTAVMAVACGSLGDIYRHRGDFARSETMYHKALEIDLQRGDLDGQAKCYGNLGILNRMKGDLDDAEALHKKSLAMDDARGDLDGMAANYGNIGIIYGIRGDLDQAETMYHKAMEINEKLGREDRNATALSNLATIRAARWDLDGAEVLYRRSLAIEKRLGRLPEIASDYGNLGYVLRTRGDLDEAEAMYRNALEIDEKLGRRDGVAAGHSSIGIVMLLRGDLAAAEAMFLKALAVDQTLGKPHRFAADYGNLGNIAASQGHHDRAKELWIKSRDAYLQGGLKDMADRLQKLIDDAATMPSAVG